MVTRTKQAQEDPETKRRRQQAEQRAERARTDATKRDLDKLTEDLLRTFGRKTSATPAFASLLPGFTLGGGAMGLAAALAAGGGRGGLPGGGGGGGSSGGGSFDPGAFFVDPNSEGGFGQYGYLSP